MGKGMENGPKKIHVSDEELKKFVGEADIAAIELFYKTKDNTDFYLGLQFSRDLKNAPTPYDFFKIYFSVLKSEGDLSLQNVIKLLGTQLDNNKTMIQINEPTSIAIGVVDFWMTYSPCIIWKRGEEKNISNSIIKTKLVGHENLVQNKDNYTGLELIYDGAAKYWLSFQVSIKQGEDYVLQENIIKNVLSSYALFKS